MTITNTPLYTDLQAEIQRVLALKLIADLSFDYESERDYAESCGKLIHTHGPAILALAERLEAAEQWKHVVIDALVTDFIYESAHDNDPKKALQDAIEWNIKVALDPAVSADAAALHERLAVAEERVRVLGNMLDPVLDQLTVANKRLQALTKVAEPFARFNGSENPMRPEINALRGMIANLSSGTPTNRKYREARMAGAEALAKYDAGEGK